MAEKELTKNHDRFNEATRVQMPALVHLTRLGYEYIGKIPETSAGTFYDPSTNILLDTFKTQFKKLNPEYEGHAEETLNEIRQELNNDDLGRSFFKRLQAVSPVRLIDFDHPENNTYQCTAEFTCKNGDEEFRPDITLFVNGLPLVFIEVKKPNNRGGMVAESERMNKQRLPNKKFRRFINITQFMIFSNNMEYDAMGGIVPVQGAFYCTAARKYAPFNCFREENPKNQPISPYNNDYSYKEIDSSMGKSILDDFNCQVLYHAPEYRTNLNINTPTNRIITSMCTPERLMFILKYALVYVRSEKEEDGKLVSVDQKHIMRYQQMFASLSIREKLLTGKKSGVIWHTQGSGKTALAYYLTKVLTDFYSSQNKVTKFYFIVDRIDLLEQASQEFEARGLSVKTASTRAELMEQFRTNQSQQGVGGKSEITVVNIQRFAEDKERVSIDSYATNLQRIFIIDEAHRGYKPEGSFLANLFDADRDSVKIALTGTPLLKEERASWKIFGEYFHTYYYDKSIQDGYTLKIIREEIETSYKEKLTEIYKSLETLVQKKELRKSQIIEHETYVKELLRYIINDLVMFRNIHGDDTLGGMIICETSEQARQLKNYFDEVQNEINEENKGELKLKAELILHDSYDKETRKQIVTDFKKNMTIDLLIVFNMLLTGFDAPRLKRLYLGRKLKDHNLLQAITRVNRPYKDNMYGYLIDFADIKANFAETNEMYMKELGRFNNPEGVEPTPGDDIGGTFTQVLEDPKTLIATMEDLRQTLFDYSTDNVEDFSSEISTIEDKKVLIDLRKVLTSARDCCNLVRTFGSPELKEAFKKLEISKVAEMLSEVQHCINNMNQKEAFHSSDDTKVKISEAMMDIKFNFKKVDEEELKIVSGDDLQGEWNKTIRAFSENIDQEDPEYMTLHQAFIERFKEHGFVVNDMDEYKDNVRKLREILQKLHELKHKNENLLKKYKGDRKFVRVHKRIKETNETKDTPIISDKDEKIVYVLTEIKKEIDSKVYDRNNILKKDAYFAQTVMVQIANGMNKLEILGTLEDKVFIRDRITKQYLDQYNATYSVA